MKKSQRQTLKPKFKIRSSLQIQLYKRSWSNFRSHNLSLKSQMMQHTHFKKILLLKLDK